MATRTWTLKIRGDPRDAVQAVDKVERRFKNLDINKGLRSKLSAMSKDFDGIGAKVGQGFGAGFTRGADGRLRDAKGRFARIGGESGRGYGKAFGDGAERSIWSRISGIGSKIRGSFQSDAQMGDQFKKFAGGLVSRGKPLAVVAGTAFSANLIGSIVGGLASGAAKVVHGVGAIAALLPAAALAGGLAFGALKLAISGVGDAFKAGFAGDAEKFAEATKNMSQSAKEFTTEIVALKPRLDDLRKTVQENFFERIDDQAKHLARVYLPALQRELSLTARWFGMAAGATLDFLGTPRVVAAVTTSLGYAQRAIGNLAAGIPALVAAFLPLITVGSTFLPGLTGGFQGATMRLAQFMQQAERTGKLREFIQGGLDKLRELWETTKQVGRIFEDLGGIANKLFGGLQMGSGTMLDTIERVADQFNRFLETAKGGGVKGQIFEVLGNLADNFLGTLQHLATTLGGALAPILPPLIAAMAALTGVKFALITALEPFVKVLALGLSAALGKLAIALKFVSGNKAAMAALTGVIVVLFAAWAYGAATAAIATLAAAAPFIAVGVAIGLLAYLVVTHFDTIVGALKAAWDWVKQFWPLLAVILLGPFALLIPLVRAHWDKIRGAIEIAVNAIMAVVRFFVDIAIALWQRFGDSILDFVRRTWDAIWMVIQGVLNVIMGIVRLVMAVIRGDWSGAWEAIQQIVAGVWGIIQGLIDMALAKIRFIIELALNTIWMLVQAIWNGILATIQFVWGLIVGYIQLQIAILTAALSLGWNIMWATVTTIWNAIWGTITFVWGLITGSVRSQIDAVKAIVENGMKAISDVWNWIWGGMSGALTAIWDGIKSGVTSGVNAVIDVINWFIRLLNNIPGVDIGEIGKVGQRGGGRSRGAGGTERGLAYARGGITDGPQYLVGEGNRTWPEAVIATDPKYRQRNIGLLSWAADRMGVPMGFKRGGVPGFAIGGIPGGDIVSGALGPIGSAIAGEAAELGTQLASGVGLTALNKARDLIKGAVGRIPGPFGYVRDMGRGVVDKMYDHAKGVIEAMEAASASGGGPGGNAGYGGGGVERWRGTALQALAMTGSPANWIGSLLRRMNQESGGNPNAINYWDENWTERRDPSGGLMQNIRSAYASRVAGFPSLRGTNFLNPLGSIVASIVYTIGRYGSGPAGWDKSGGYKRGGLLSFDNGGVLPEDVMGVGASGQRYKFQRAERITSAQQAGSGGAPRLVVEGDIVIHANDREGGRQAAKGYMGYLAERGVIVDARIA